MNENDRSGSSRRAFCAAAVRWTAFGALVGGSAALVARNNRASREASAAGAGPASCARFGANGFAARCGECPAALHCPVAGAADTTGAAGASEETSETPNRGGRRRAPRP